ncbi:uncharacterized protein EDB91DRAFT_1142616 [Suillus paluster]|uniref:uncharacterized protein n=1 Tax=Suillus paluster TaxID=48578 RepID=UPI001B86498E|nr:uncharacterized protein EDB91DRAFT_1142616 [Suillus paluster]KAG1736074.1 hypothetical protein EDB91DRAFT_1142616 [Suillus paluster]
MSASRSLPTPSLPPTARYRSRPTHGLATSRTPAPRRTSVSGLAATGQKAQRTSKTTQKLVLLPSAPQTKPLRIGVSDDILGYETDAGVVREYKSAGERMSKEQRKRAGYKRITAYCIAEELRMKLLASLLKREHNVMPRVFDEAMYVMYHLPLLPGYGPNTSVRSSAAPVTEAKSLQKRLAEAEENGYQGSYFIPQEDVPRTSDGYMTSGSHAESHRPPPRPELESEAEAEYVDEGEGGHYGASERSQETREREEHERHEQVEVKEEDRIAEVVFFAYGVAVFFGLDEGQERAIVEDIRNAGILKRPMREDDWEIEECHFAHDPTISYPRIYHDFFTFKSHSHLLKLSVAHALAQSTLLAHYESVATSVLSSPSTVSIPRQLASSGALNLKRRDAMRLTGKLFKLRRDVNLVSNVLDVPELFWSEASLGGLYEAVREYMEIGERVQVLNEKLGMASEFLDAIHDHLNNNAMERITWIVIWLIVVAILVELGEVIARLVVHATMGGEKAERIVLRGGGALRALFKIASHR